MSRTHSSNASGGCTVERAVPGAAAWQTALLPADVVVQCTNALLAAVVLVFATRIERPSLFGLFHAAWAVLFVALARYGRRDDTPGCRAGWVTSLLQALHLWLPALFNLAIYFELGLLIPQLHALDALPVDHALQALDVWLLGDALALVAHVASPLLSELLTFCYWSYYAFPFVLPAVLYARGDLRAFERVVVTLLVAFACTYAGYLLLPALGPHRLFDGPRLAALAGYGVAGKAYQLLSTLALEPPDAFPSGHTLIGVLVPTMAYRVHRTSFLVLAPLGAGMVLATLYLRFHYVADVLASLALVPVVYRLGASLERRLA